MSLDRLQREYNERMKKRIKNKKKCNIAYEKLSKRTSLTPNPFKMKAKKVAMIDVETGEVVQVFASLKVAGSSISKHYHGISQCINGRQKTAYGYKWEEVL